MHFQMLATMCKCSPLRGDLKCVCCFLCPAVHREPLRHTWAARHPAAEHEHAGSARVSAGHHPLRQDSPQAQPYRGLSGLTQQVNRLVFIQGFTANWDISSHNRTRTGTI